MEVYESEKLPKLKTNNSISSAELSAFCPVINCPFVSNEISPFNFSKPYRFDPRDFFNTSPSFPSLEPPGPPILYHHDQLRLPLPPLKFGDEPQYVNAKQHRRILKMREKRQQQPKRAKALKKYIHESRHRHAIKRQRRKNGRFVSKKNTEKEPRKEISEVELSLRDESGSMDQIEIEQSQYKVIE